MTNRTRPKPAAASTGPPTDATGSCSILEQCRPGQRVRLPPAPQEIARSFITSLRFSMCAPSRHPASPPLPPPFRAGFPTTRASYERPPDRLVSFPVFTWRRRNETCIIYLRAPSWKVVFKFAEDSTDVHR